MAATRPCVVYARVSQDRGDAQSVEEQLSECEREAERRGWAITETYVDRNISASKAGTKRPDYLRLLEGICSGQVDTLLVYMTDRLYRQPRELEDLIDCVPKGFTFGTVRSGDLDLGTPEGRAFARNAATWNKLESEKLSERVLRTKAARRTEGVWSGGGRRPYGYHVVGGKGIDGYPARLQVDDEEVSVIREAVTLALGGNSLFRIAATLNDRSVPTAGGGRWRPAHVKRLLLSPFHAGMLPTGVAGNWPAIVSVKEQLALRAMFTTRTGTPREGRRYVLSGIANCGACSTPLVGSAGYYRCSAQSGGCGKVSTAVPALDGYVLREVRAQVGRMILEAVPVTETPDALERDDVLVELADVQTRLDGLAENFAVGVLDARQVKVAGDRLRTRKGELEAQLRSEVEAQPFPLFDVDLDSIEKWNVEKILDVRNLVRTVARSIELSKGRGFAPERVAITWAEPGRPATFEIMKGDLRRPAGTRRSKRQAHASKT